MQEELDRLEADLMKEQIRRKGLGGYSMEAEGMLLFNESLLSIVRILQNLPATLGVKAKK